MSPVRRVVVKVAGALAGLILVSGCSDDNPPIYEPEQVLMKSCYDAGGVYFEYEDTSAGDHIWCATEDGREIGIEYRGDN